MDPLDHIADLRSVVTHDGAHCHIYVSLPDLTYMLDMMIDDFRHDTECQEGMSPDQLFVATAVIECIKNGLTETLVPKE